MPEVETDALRETLILAVTRGFHEFTGGHPDYPDYDEVSCSGGGTYHCEAGHEHGSRGVCWACEPPSAHVVDAVLLPAITSAVAEALREAGIKVGKMRHGVTGRRVANAEYLGEVVYAMGDEVLYQAERRMRLRPGEGDAQ